MADIQGAWASAFSQGTQVDPATEGGSAGCAGSTHFRNTFKFVSQIKQRIGQGTQLLGCLIRLHFILDTTCLNRGNHVWNEMIKCFHWAAVITNSGYTQFLCSTFPPQLSKVPYKGGWYYEPQFTDEELGRAKRLNQFSQDHWAGKWQSWK